MGFKKQSELRRAENEVIFREHNARLSRQLSRVLPSENQATYLIEFICECSNERCHDRIALSLSDFEHHSKASRRFIVKPHHEQLDIEHVVESRPDFVVIEKYENPPSTDGVLNQT